MKQYKLLKDTPIFNAGTIFEGRVDGSGNLKALASLTAFGPQALPDFAIKDINNFDDWFEEIIPAPSIRSRVAYGCIYYYVNSYGIVSRSHEYRNKDDDYLYGIGNYFKTEEDAEVYKKYLIARQMLLDDAKGGRFTPDGNNYVGSYSCGTWDSTFVCNYFTGDIYFKTEEALEKSLKVHKDQWEIVRKYEMGEE